MAYMTAGRAGASQRKRYAVLCSYLNEVQDVGRAAIAVSLDDAAYIMNFRKALEEEWKGPLSHSSTTNVSFKESEACVEYPSTLNEWRVVPDSSSCILLEEHVNFPKPEALSIYDYPPRVIFKMIPSVNSEPCTLHLRLTGMTEDIVFQIPLRRRKPSALPLSEGHLKNVFENTRDLSYLCSDLHIPPDKRTPGDAVEYCIRSTQPKKGRKMVFYLDVIGDTALADSVMECAEPPADPSFIPSHVIPVFQALTGDWKKIGRYRIVPGARAQLFRERFSVPDQRTEAGRYYALYHPDPSWKRLSVRLYRAGETEALQIARPHIQTVTDPSLTPDNILKATRDIPLWESRISYCCLNMPMSLHDEIARKFDGEQAKRELFSRWLAGHPCPTWDHVEWLLRELESEGRGRVGAAEEVKETYLKNPQVITDERAQQIIDQAMESGSVEQRDVVAVLTGLMGSGKTCLLNRLFHQQPPDVYTSTGIAEQAYRGMLHHIGNMSTGAWKLLSDKDMRECLAPLFLAGMTEANVATLAADLVAMGLPNTTSDHYLPLPPPPSSDALSNTLSPATLPTTPMAPSLPQVSPACQAMVRLVKQTAGSKFILELLHMIDTGGQPEYMEVMPCLIHNANLALLVVNLMYGLDEQPTLNYHVKGVAYERKLLSQYTSRQIILKLVSTLKCKKFSRKVFRILVVATHPDCVEGDLAARIDALNKELRNLLLPACKDELILCSSPDKVAFVLNLKKPDSDDDKTLELIRTNVGENGLGKVVSVPGSFFMYEQDLFEFARSINQDILSLNQCLQVGDRLKMNGEVVKAALVFFHRHNTFLYFRHVLPDVVFVRPQIPLDFVNAIVRFSYRVSAGDIHGIPAKFVLWLEHAIITEEMLSHDELSSCFIPGLYEAQHAIKLFCHTFTIAPLSHDRQQPKTSEKSLQPTSGMPSGCKEYLMMCLLPAIPNEELPEHIPSSSHIVPLVVKFTDDCVPLSCFGCTISCLLSTFKWEVNRKVDGTPNCLAHNIVSLFDPELSVKIVLVDSTRHIAVHIDEDDREFLPEISSQVRETVFGAVKKVFDVMKLTEIEVSPAVLCPCSESSEAHCASYCARHFKQKTQHILRCPKTNTRVGDVVEDYILKWLCSDKELQPVDQSNDNLSLDRLVELRVPEQVSTKFRKFGTLLLKDGTGAHVDNIEEGLRGMPERINTEILKDWLRGKGLPVTWGSLLHTLRACELNELANKIQKSLHM